MGRYVSWDDQLKKRAATKKQHADRRKGSRELTETFGKSLQGSLRTLISDCGLSQVQLSDFSGIIPACVSRFMQRYNPRARFNTIVGLAHAAGYKIEFVPVAPEKDYYRRFRRLKPSSLHTDDKK